MSHPVHSLLSAPLPLIPLRGGVVLPGRKTTVPLGRARSVALGRSIEAGQYIALAVQRDPKTDDPGIADLHDIAVLALVKDKSDRGRRGVILSVEGVERFRLTSLVQTRPYWLGRGGPVVEANGNTDEAILLADSLRSRVRELVPDDQTVKSVLSASSSPGMLADQVAAWLDIDAAAKVRVLATLDVEERLRLTSDLLKSARARAELRQKIDSQVRSEMSKSQKDAMLRQQLRAIQKELGEGEASGEDPLREKLDAKQLPEEVQKVVDRELGRLSSMNAQQAEANIIRSYLELIGDLPWTERAEASSDIDSVATILDEDHHGLEEVKKRILEHMAVLKLTAEARGSILCLVGPPGVGKTSLAQSVARATGRPLQRVSLGGVRDEAEVRGHRRTYVGALPGRILAALRKAQVKNPVIVLDEIDKLGRGWNGDPEAALLEVLDPEQNHAFTDHYLELPFDLSEVLFIATANELGTLSPPLRDRLEIIELAGYTTDEKVQIAQDHLFPKELSRHGLAEDSVLLDDEEVGTIVRDYTREAGVRQLTRQLAKLCRSIALDVARRDDSEGEIVRIDEPRVRDVLGRPRFFRDSAERANSPGVAAGLAWTPVGGDILYIETTKMPGKGRLEITGQLGDVMSESARAALAYVRSHADELAVDPALFETTDLHLHVPAGAVPKDGPSAGVTIFTALTSLLSGQKVRGDTAMTGEATLRGKVLPVGGIKAKVLAAHRAGFARVILPARNEPDIDDVPESVRAELDLHYVTDMREVLALALDGDAFGGGAPDFEVGEASHEPTSGA